MKYARSWLHGSFVTKHIKSAKGFCQCASEIQAGKNKKKKRKTMKEIAKLFALHANAIIYQMKEISFTT